MCDGAASAAWCGPLRCTHCTFFTRQGFSFQVVSSDEHLANTPVRTGHRGYHPRIANACPICDSVARAGRGEYSRLIAPLRHGLLVLGDNQACEGWCVLLLNRHVEHMADLPLTVQEEVFGDCARAANAIRAVFGPVRINYECLGNQVAHVHWHLIPRHADDPEPRQPVWGWGPECLRGRASEARRDEIVRLIRAALDKAC